MHGLAVWQQDNAKIPAVHFIDPSLTQHPAIGLDALPLRGGDNAQVPFVLDDRTVGTRANHVKVFRNLDCDKFPLALTSAS